MAADLSHLLSVAAKKQKYEKTVKEMFLQWGELRKGKRSYQAIKCAFKEDL